MDKICLSMNSVYAGGFPVVVQRDVNAVSRLHQHKFVEIVYFYHGVGVHYVTDKEYNVKAGDLYIFNSGRSHQFKGKDLRLINIMFPASFISPQYSNENFLGEFYRNSFTETDEMPFEKEGVLCLPDFSSEMSNQTIFNILQEFNAKMDGWLRVVRNKIDTLVISAIRMVSARQYKNQPSFSHRAILEKAICLIDENFMMLKTVDDVTTKIGYNKLYFNRLFKDYTGVSIAEYIRKKKMDESTHLLTHTNYTVEKISEIIGYSDIKSFYNAFKKIIGTSPGEYRAKLFSGNKEKLNPEKETEGKV